MLLTILANNVMLKPRGGGGMGPRKERRSFQRNQPTFVSVKQNDDDEVMKILERFAREKLSN